MKGFNQQVFNVSDIKKYYPNKIKPTKLSANDNKKFRKKIKS